MSIFIITASLKSTVLNTIDHISSYIQDERFLLTTDIVETHTFLPLKIQGCGMRGVACGVKKQINVIQPSFHPPPSTPPYQHSTGLH